MSNSLPIGVFDSGIGGLTVASAMKSHLPEESIHYLGDTARCPYGDRQPQEVLGYSLEICDFLYTQGVKMLVVACNTATAVALSTLEKRYDIPVIGVVRPGARAALGVTERGNIGVIGTAVTISSNVYELAVHSMDPSVEVHSLACPEFVPLVESGQVDGDYVRSIVSRSLEPLLHCNIDTLILGCTHYPHLQSVIQEVMGDRVKLISSADETALEVERVLLRNSSYHPTAEPVADHFYTTGDGERMRAALTEWLGFNTMEAAGCISKLALSDLRSSVIGAKSLI